MSVLYMQNVDKINRQNQIINGQNQATKFYKCMYCICKMWTKSIDKISVNKNIKRQSKCRVRVTVGVQYTHYDNKSFTICEEEIWYLVKVSWCRTMNLLMTFLLNIH